MIIGISSAIVLAATSVGYYIWSKKEEVEKEIENTEKEIKVLVQMLPTTE
jgi:hypothetical protein